MMRTLMIVIEIVVATRMGMNAKSPIIIVLNVFLTFR